MAEGMSEGGGPLLEEIQGRFVEVVPTPEGNVAVVSLTGRVWNASKEETPGMKFSGTIRFNLDVRPIISQVVELTSQDRANQNWIKLVTEICPVPASQPSARGYPG